MSCDTAVDFFVVALFFETILFAFILKKAWLIRRRSVRADDGVMTVNKVLGTTATLVQLIINDSALYYFA